jgi:SAM-dependent methyltransferase
MNRIKSFMLNLKLLFTDDFAGRWQAQDERLDSRLSERSREIADRMEALESALNARADVYERAIDHRLDEQRVSLETRLDSYEATLDSRIEDRLLSQESTIDKRLADFEVKADARGDEFEAATTKRISDFEAVISTRLDTFEEAVTRRGTEFEESMDERAENRFLEAETRLDARLEAAEKRLDEALAEAQKLLDARFDERERKSDIRFDDRLVRTERYIDSRFAAFETSTDSRMETHERTVDGKLHQRSQDIIDRTDLMLQVLDQRLDKFRREIRALAAAKTVESGNPEPTQSTNESRSANESENRGGENSRVSFRKLSESEARLLTNSGANSPGLYHQMLEWKNAAQDGIYDFTPDEQEIANYILSFQNDPREISYVKHHMRRFLTTIKRIPPARNSSDRILELGSLGHLTPAIRKYSGYKEFFGGDHWNEAEKSTVITVAQPEGGEKVEFELRNFNVETDEFPYPDGFFQTVLCCELLEHLIRDPMHMLWECNRVLSTDGFLLVSTPNIASCQAIEGVLTFCTPYHFSQYNVTDRADQHNREYSPVELQWALEAAGFKVILLETEDVWLRSNPAILDLLKKLQLSTELRADNLFALAKKTTAPVTRYPEFLYVE